MKVSTKILELFEVARTCARTLARAPLHKTVLQVVLREDTNTPKTEVQIFRSRRRREEEEEEKKKKKHILLHSQNWISENTLQEQQDLHFP
jgi:hypothetical protein